MQDQYSRTQLLLGKEAMEKLHNSRVAVFGIGGVGGYTVEALARSGVGALDLIDDDKVCLTNLNRQIVATRKTVGQYKVDVAEQRVHEIDPNIKVTTYKTFFTPETQDQFDFTQYDYVVDAIDTVTGKLALVVKAKEAGTPIICAMGAGNKMDPTRFEVTDIYKTSVCPLAKVMRTECRKRKIKHLKVVYSKEPVMTPIEDDSISCKNHCICPPGTQRKCTIRRSAPGSNAFVPSVAGLIIGGEVVKDLGRICADERLKTRTPLSSLTDAGEGRFGSGKTAPTAWAQVERASGRRAAACPGVTIGSHPSKHNVEIRSFDKILLLIYTEMHIHMQKSRIEDRKYCHADFG